MALTPERIQVLIAEDSVTVAEMLQFQLEDMGYQVIGNAVNGVKAVEMAKDIHPDLILMDLDMPDMDGIEAAQIIQVECPTPIVVLSAYSDSEHVKAASTAGAGAYLVKPVNPGELDRAIHVAIARFDDFMEVQHMSAELAAYDYSVCHDLKSPLNLILPYAELLRREHATLSPQQLEDYTAIIEVQARRARAIIESLLLLARPDDLSLKPLDMVSLVTDACAGLELLIDNYDAEVHVPETLPHAMGHPVLVERVWDNYLNNAIKYGGRPPVIEIGGAMQDNGMASFWVQDNGPGLSKEDQARLFDPFTRLSDTKEPWQSSGLGLSIVRRIVRKLGGQVRLESKLGCGSIFSFTLPGCVMQDRHVCVDKIHCI